MSRPAQAPDASMEDILASIRKIITEDAGDARAQPVATPDGPTVFLEEARGALEQARRAHEPN